MAARRRIRAPVKQHRRPRPSIAPPAMVEPVTPASDVRNALREVGEWLETVDVLLDEPRAA